MMATVDEIKKVRNYVRTQPENFGWHKHYAEDYLTSLIEEEQQRELEAFGGDVRSAAAAGWNALRVRNPRVDREDGAGNEVRVFEDLPHKVKLNYLTFAQGAVFANVPQRVVLGMNGPGSTEASGGVFTAPFGAPLPMSFDEPLVGFEEVGTVAERESAEPVVFEKGDKVKVTGPRTWGGGVRNDYLGFSEVVTVCSGYVDRDGDLLVRKADGDTEYILATSLTKIAPVVFEKGDRVKITGPQETSAGHSRLYLLDGTEHGTVIEPCDDAGDVRIKTDGGLFSWIAATSLTKVKEEPSIPFAFKPGDRVRITGPHVTIHGGTQSVDGEYGTVVRHDGEGSVHLTDESGVGCYLDPASLTLVTEPRTWERLEDIPEDVHQVTDCDGDPLRRDESKVYGWACGCDADPEFGHSIQIGYAPFTEVQP